jgi:hypothetical protein
MSSESKSFDISNIVKEWIEFDFQRGGLSCNERLLPPLSG